jgi:hypothetical protein
MLSNRRLVKCSTRQNAVESSIGRMTGLLNIRMVECCRIVGSLNVRMVEYSNAVESMNAVEWWNAVALLNAVE